MRTLPWLLLPLLGCAEPPEAPTELSDLNGFLFLHLDDDGTAKLALGMANLKAFLDGVPAAELDVELNTDDGVWSPPPLDEASWGTATIWEDAVADNQLGIAVGGTTAYPPEDHGGLVGLVDQTPLESESSASYERSFDSDLDCFLDHSCDQLDTTAQVHRQNLLLDVHYENKKQFRWVELPDSAGMGFLARSWVEQPYTGEDGANVLRQFTTLEVHVPSAEGARAYTAVWGEIDWGSAPDESIQRNTTRNGIREAYRNKEAYLDAN